MSKRFQVVVAGWGNSLRGDDGAGRWVADSIAARWFDSLALWERAGVRVVSPADRRVVDARPLAILSGQQPLPEWAPILARADVAILVDATSDPAATDVRITKLDLVTLPAFTSGHAFGARELLALAASLYGRAPEAFLVEIPASSFDFAEGSSPRTARAAVEAVRWIEARLKAELEGRRGYPPLSPSLSPTTGERGSEPARAPGEHRCTNLD
jgi:hydrogenase maturation protease